MLPFPFVTKATLNVPTEVMLRKKTQAPQVAKEIQLPSGIDLK